MPPRVLKVSFWGSDHDARHLSICKGREDTSSAAGVTREERVDRVDMGIAHFYLETVSEMRREAGTGLSMLICFDVEKRTR